MRYPINPALFVALNPAGSMGLTINNWKSL